MQSASKRVIKNTGILYLRLAITALISLYTTRLVLNTLGVVDFGLFNVVAGVIAFLGFLNSSLAAATQRYISFAQGAGDLEKIKKIFNMSVILHWVIAILILFILELAGSLFFNGILNIPEDRVNAAKIVYQFMIVSTLFTVISVPYDAVLTSHENMFVYAVLGVLESLLKLSIAYYITLTNFDKLLVYGLLMTISSILLLLLRRIYCHRFYQECRINLRKFFDKKLLLDLGGFAGWTLIGSASSMIAAYGQGIVLNVFFGTVVNAAQGIANQVSGQLGVFAGSMQKALNPLIDKSEGAGNRLLTLKASTIGSKISFFLLMITFLPVLIEMPFIFKIWLKNPPENAIVFCSLLLIKNLIEQSYTTLTATIAAVGDIKKFQIVSALINILPLFISYVLFYFGFPAFYLYISFLIYSIIQAFVVLYFANVNCGISVKSYVFEVIFRCWLTFILVMVLALIPHYLLESNLVRFSFVTLTSILFSLLGIYWIGITKEEKTIIWTKFKEIRARINFFSLR